MPESMKEPDGAQKAKKTIDFYLRNKSIVTIDPSVIDEDNGSQVPLNAG